MNLPRSLVAIFTAAGLLAAPASGYDQESRPAPVTLIPVISGLQQPVYVTAPRSEPNRLYVVERRGRIRVVVGGRVRAQPFLDIRSRVRSGGLLGLFSLAFHPRYAANGQFYVSYSGHRGNVYVVRFRARAGVAIRSSARILLHAHTSPSRFTHAGGHLAFGPDGDLYVGLGDGSDEAAPQDLASPLGKILRLDVEDPGAAPEVVAYGLRNPWRFSFDRGTGDLYIGDVGAGAWEEVNYLARESERPVNLGWSAYEGRHRRSSRPPASSGPLVFPIAAYRHGKGCRAIVGGYVSRGSTVPALRGRYVFGDLCLGAVWSLRVVRGKATGMRRERIAVPQLLVSFGEGSRGELYAVSLGAGIVYRVGRR